MQRTQKTKYFTPKEKGSKVNFFVDRQEDFSFPTPKSFEIEEEAKRLLELYNRKGISAKTLIEALERNSNPAPQVFLTKNRDGDNLKIKTVSISGLIDAISEDGEVLGITLDQKEKEALQKGFLPEDNPPTLEKLAAKLKKETEEFGFVMEKKTPVPGFDDGPNEEDQFSGLFTPTPEEEKPTPIQDADNGPNEGEQFDDLFAPDPEEMQMETSFWDKNFPNWINNFSDLDLPLYKRSIRRYREEVKNPIALVIKKEAYDYKGTLLKRCFSLHYMNDEKGNIDRFWVIYREEDEKQKKNRGTTRKEPANQQ